MNFRSIRSARAALSLSSAFLVVSASAQGVLEIPAANSTYSGIGVISGWHCSATRIEVSIDGGPPRLAGSHTERLDTLGVCGRADTGFSLLFNWNTLPTSCFGCRFHRVVALADGVPFADTQFQAENFGAEFMTGKTAQYDLLNFPDTGSITTLRWDEALQGFSVYLAATNQISVAGTYYGALQTGAQNPACGPFPPNREFAIKHGKFIAQVANGRLALSAQYVDGTSCQLPEVAIKAASASSDDGYAGAVFDAAATAACPEFPAGLDVRLNGRRLVADSLDNCRTGHVMAAK